MRYSSQYAAILVTVVFVGGCHEPTEPTDYELNQRAIQDTAYARATTSDFGLGSDFPDLTPEIQEQLASLRAYASGMHTVDLAARGGFDTPITDCLENPPVGGMGFHYANLGRLFDTSPPAVLEPEILVFPRGQNGQQRLGAVEYFIPYGDDFPQAGSPPVLFGQAFSRNDGAGGWMLHVWLWNHNPAGMFATWNPTVSCETG
jgi:hypothetical protein